MLRIALPNKGRLSEEARELFTDAGLDVRAASARALTASLGGEFEALFVRAQDIPEFVADGAADTGVTGFDLVSESGRELETLVDLGFGRCRLVVAAREESGITAVADLARARRVATSFPRLTRRWFDEQGIPIDVVPVSGAAEIAPHIGIADVVVDLTSTGSTLRVNGLREIVTLTESTARLVARPGASAGDDPRAKSLRELVTALVSVLRARGQRYLMANVPRAALEGIRRVLPGLDGPTVTEVMNGGTIVAVHAVVPAQGIYRTITDLQSLGATGILVTRIERLMP
ncbi:MAG: ATP phosphoribosyltransferase [Candidatus Eisenbacteria bacterium]|nr:ATP phosphoribosyltransferase [Candidatus Eisenbacteria bacterium]